jgi:Mg-chelatase subunit ChlD
VKDEGGITFYGIHILSDRVLFVLDVSGSMDQAARPGPEGQGGEARIAVARREMAGAVNNLNDGDRFNLILFNHQVLLWQPGKMVESTETTRRQAARWGSEQPPTGGTNIHDALEAAFAMALRVTGRPEVDTILFMTDGRPTAGKVQDPARILEEVRLWNRAARLKIHCVGVGEHDEAFLQALAEIGNGQYVKR